VVVLIIERQTLCLNEKSAEASLVIALASCALNESQRNLPTMTAMLNWLMT
jgi:hypothetical protein